MNFGLEGKTKGILLYECINALHFSEVINDIEHEELEDKLFSFLSKKERREVAKYMDLGN